MAVKGKKKKPLHTHPEDAIEGWMRSHWRPAMAWSYMAICLFDFIIAPTGTAFLITFHKSTLPVWSSLTLSNGGVMHLAFGAILGVSAWGRTKESITNTSFGPYGPGTTVIDRQTDVVEPRGPQRHPSPRPRPDDEDEQNTRKDDNVVIPKPKQPVIE